MHSPESLLNVILGFGEPDAMHLTSIVSPTVVITLLGSSIHFGDASKIVLRVSYPFIYILQSKMY